MISTFDVPLKNEFSEYQPWTYWPFNKPNATIKVISITNSFLTPGLRIVFRKKNARRQNSKMLYMCPTGVETMPNRLVTLKKTAISP